ncbi:MAG: putative bifunctional diguanylate cyclase/phosphodiesterase [Thermoanaerobaculia bacterium]
MKGDSSDRPPVRVDLIGDRQTFVRIGMFAVFVACSGFAVARLMMMLRTGQRTPWGVNAAGLLAIAALYLWFRRDPGTRSGPAAHATALVATFVLLVPVAYGMTSSIWWLSLVGFAMVFFGRRREVWVWGVSIPFLVVVATLLESRIRLPGTAAEPPLESTLSKTVFAVLLVGVATAFRGVAERRALARRRSEERTRALAEELRESRQKLLLVLDNIPQLVFWKDLDSVYQGCNTNFAVAAGVGVPSAIVGKTDLDLPWKGTEAEQYRRDDRAVMESGRPKLRFAETQLMADGKLAHVETSKIPLQDAEGNVVGVLGTYEDVTERREAEKRIEYLAYHDGLTGLPNRMLLEDRLAQAIASARRHGRMVAVLFLDLDHFKAVNDRHGHEGGDELLREMARRLATVVRSGDTVARLGGDEFVVLLVELGGRSDILATIERILSTIRPPVVLEGTPVTLTASLGVAVFPDQESSGEELLRYADAAMYQAKERGRDCYVFFDPSVARALPVHHRDWEEVATGFAGREFTLVYQPTVNMRSGAVIGAEALLRWNRPGQGLRPPAEFLPAVERTDLIVDIGSWVLEEAISRLEEWRGRGLDLRMGVNVAARQIQHPGFFEAVRSALARHPLVPPDRLEIEILETTALDDVGVVQGTMARCRELGVRFCLDDFGTGYSSLSYLKRLPVDVVKIDQSFVRNMLHDREDLAIVEGVLSMAAIFGRQVVAEGVADPGHPPLLLRLGCDLAQGYLIARPMPAEEFPAFVKAWRPDAAWVRKASQH